MVINYSGILRYVPGHSQGSTGASAPPPEHFVWVGLTSHFAYVQGWISEN